MHNAAYKELGLNCMYIPLKVNSENLENIIQIIKALGIRGCSVSMPHKSKIIKYLDKIDEKSKEIGAVNTVINYNGKLNGYNTDYYGILTALNEIYDSKGKEAIVIGAGGIARAAVSALKDSGFKKISILNRTSSKAKNLAKQFNVDFLEMKNLENIAGDIFINATPIGTNNIEQKSLINKKLLKKFEVVLDVAINQQETNLIKIGKELNLIVIPGHRIALLQAAKQFEMYTGQKAPLKVMEKSLMNLIGVKI